MLNTTALLVALSTTGLLGHKGCGGAKMHHARHQQVTCTTVAAPPTCGTTYAQPMATGQAIAPTAQATAPMMARPMASPSAPVPPAPADTVPPAPEVPPAPAAPAPAPPAPSGS